jgi:predicted transcriptional regulator
MQNGYMTDDLIRQRLAAELNRGATRKQLCHWLQISEPFLSQFLSRTRPHASPTMLKMLGYDPIRYYKRTGDEL